MTSEDLKHVDKLLLETFERALGAMSTDLVEKVMARIARQQRHRLTALALTGLIAIGFCVVNVLPLFGMAFNGLMAFDPANWSAQLPAIVVGLVLVLGSLGLLNLFAEELG